MFIQIKRIIEEGVMSLFYDIDGKRKSKKKLVVFFILVFFIASFITWKLENTQNITSDLLTCLSIFTALIFAALFVIPDRLANRIRLLKFKKDDASRGYLTRFYNLSKIIVQQMSFVIVQCVLLMVLLVAQKMWDCTILTFINSVLFIILLFYVLNILTNMYILLMDEINTSGEKID